MAANQALAFDRISVKTLTRKLWHELLGKEIPTSRWARATNPRVCIDGKAFEALDTRPLRKLWAVGIICASLALALGATRPCDTSSPRINARGGARHTTSCEHTLAASCVCACCWCCCQCHRQLSHFSALLQSAPSATSGAPARASEITALHVVC